MAKNLGYEQAELEVISNNKGAIELYKKLGFEKYGSFPNNIKYSPHALGYIPVYKTILYIFCNEDS